MDNNKQSPNMWVKPVTMQLSLNISNSIYKKNEEKMKKKEGFFSNIEVDT